MVYRYTGVFLLWQLHRVSLTLPTFFSICLEFLHCLILCCNMPKAASLLTNGIHRIQGESHIKGLSILCWIVSDTIPQVKGPELYEHDISTRAEVLD